ncbi:M81 family metallopeptidase [Jeotgalibacillus sp. ET6]|uniref:M81 family metallopeptidase n=1 Tax=Jeotgalibacillus sp. ET6 TaxID=3037260 RepID=UPI0024187A6A|nr:M81 family metallopeptidase [Jeotgalibacillus sp. ET6]MDG5473139.1 M81 family metallopeptidase [Jeotgalibacillus sp. ET6]
MTKHKIAIGGIKHETNTFSNVKATVDMFKQNEWESGQEIINNHRGVGDYLGGIISKGEEMNVELIPTFWASANPMGLITREAYQELLANLLSSIKQVRDLDGICLVLHGGGIADGVEDLEGSILSEVREVVGKKIPIVATLDLHANLTETMINEADALLGVNFYPHTDCYERGQEAVETLIDIVEGKIKPVMHFEKLPMMIPSSTSDHSPVKDINERCWKWEEQQGVIDCTFFHGFSHTDIPDMRLSVLTTTDGDQELAATISRDVTDEIWDLREDFYLPLPGPREGLEQALSEQGGPIVINETSDNPGAGAPGDGTHLLKEMIEMNIEHACFGFMYDPETAKAAHEAGIGSRISISLGGKTDSLHGSPLAVHAYVKALSDGKFVHSTEMYKGKKMNLGKSARLQIGHVDVIVCSIRAQTFDEQMFILHGIDVTDYKIVALKSENHFRSSFTPLAKKIITVDSPGLSCYNLQNLNYKRVNRPVYPLDKGFNRREDKGSSELQ